MYVSHWLNTVNGQLYRSTDPNWNPGDPEWELLGEGEFQRLKLVADYAMQGWYDVNERLLSPSIEQPERPEFPVYYDAQGREHAEF